MIHPHTGLHWIGEAVGHGIVATRLIPKGTLIWVQDPIDQVLSPAQVEALGPAYAPLLDQFAHRDAEGNAVVCWDNTRFMNHACDYNCLGPDLLFDVALRDIPEGREITTDYASLYLLPRESFDCHCGAPNCRGRISADDVYTQRERWRRLMAEGLARVGAVPQPLMPLLDQALLARACRDYGIPFSGGPITA
ncbi:MAG: SET domain-containing protein-lysine N-methyltransferase [Betaproteobacteria bacterium]|nr:SET domain-containing protein-lysine N-methyltransferase [Betaproteobacteria bacterium]